MTQEIDISIVYYAD